MSTWPHSEQFLQLCFPALKQFDFVAKGGQKAVYSAFHPDVGPVALKILFSTDTPERFQREISAIKSINVKQVPLVTGYGVMHAPYEGHLWMTEKWIPGVTLRERLRFGQLSNKLVLRIATDILTVLVEAERNLIVHRDIKPENIIISPDESTCSLIDFGIARHLDKTSLTGMFMPCTIGYAPVEQLDALKQQIDTRSDLFSLGVTLYECVEGVNPFIQNVTNVAEVIERIHNLKLPTISRKVDINNEFANLLESMTQTRRTHRIKNADEAMNWLAEINVVGPAL